MPWSTSNRAQRLPRDWPKRREATKRRAGGRCEGIDLERTGTRAHVSGCNGIGTDCDHDVRGDDHRLTNLRWLSAECHKAKTQAEAYAAKPQRRRPPEPHPGRLT